MLHTGPLATMQSWEECFAQALLVGTYTQALQVTAAPKLQDTKLTRIDFAATLKLLIDVVSMM